MKTGKINHFESGYVAVQIHHSNKVADMTYFRQNFVNMIIPVYVYVKFYS